MKTKTSKKQEYTYSLKTAIFTGLDNDYGMPREKFLFYLLPPQESIAIKRLRMHLKIKFATSVAVEDRIIEKIGIISDFIYDENDADHIRYFEINEVADANREIELDLDLTSLLKEDYVDYETKPYLFSGNFTFVWFKIGKEDNLTASYNGGILKWKVDALFVTRGVK